MKVFSQNGKNKREVIIFIPELSFIENEVEDLHGLVDRYSCPPGIACLARWRELRVLGYRCPQL